MAYPTAATISFPASNVAIANDTSAYVYPVPYVVTLSVVLVIEMLAGVLSNMAVLFSYHVNRKFIRSVSDVFIINMNVVDIIICVVSIPATLMAVLSNPSIPLVCFFHEATVSFASVASAVNVVVISLDRYDKISHPLVRKFNMKNVRWILPITWILSLLGFCSPLFGLNFEKFDEIQQRFEFEPHHCFYWFFSSRDNHLYELYYIPIFFTATFVMIYAYYGIIRITRVKTIHSALVKATVSMKVDSNNRKVVVAANNLRDPEKRVSRTTTIIILTFITCWGPHAVISIVIVARGYLSTGEIALDMLERWLVALGYTTTLMHPILYVFMRRNFRRAFSNSWIARCAARHGLGRAHSPSHEDHPNARVMIGDVGKRQSQKNLIVNTAEDEDANRAHTSGKANDEHVRVVGEEDVQIASSPKMIGENVVLIDEDDIDSKQSVVNPCAYVIPQSEFNEPTSSAFKFNEDVQINNTNASATRGYRKNVTLPNVD